MRWHDLVNGREFWEPPGGGIEHGESPREAAARELFEETGLTVDIPNSSILVEREYDWMGRHYCHVEAFFATTTPSVDVKLTAPTKKELATFVEMRFIAPEQVADLKESVEPPTLPKILGEI
jgi:8-oxo-dGTP diphosphatase